MKQNLNYWVITVALAGFLFGFDTIVISGADQPIQKLWNTGEWFHGTFIMSMALWGTVIGALFGGKPCDKLGRKKTLFWIGVLYLVSALGSGLATDPYVFSMFRFIGGLGVGASSIAAPIYISEIAPEKDRGRLVATYQFNIVLGILVAFFSNYLIGKYMGEVAWRYMLGVEAIPAIVYCLLVLGIPNSPRWLLLHRNDQDKAKQILKRLYPENEINERIESIKSSIQKTKESFFSKKYSKPILLAFILAFFNQISGINFVLYYAPRIFEAAGIDQTNTLIASIPIGAVNLIFTMLGMYLIDKMGRKRLMTIGSIGYIVTLLGIVWSFYSGAEGAIVVFFISAYVGSHAIGQGAVIWVFISEIFPNSVRASGMSWGSSTHWVLAAIITMITPAVLAAVSPVAIFSFFAFMMLLQLIWVRLVMPETKGKKLEELGEELMNRNEQL
ncbi:sugar porter family MFS transporter [Maribacter sp. 2210JD10-5]|uniref:sugar porter family MFS transporter n=1 Tax=Maribacter sp. 2210JD10-5 TaxID=3386272 RepID=UPI0039BD91AB